MHINCRSVTSKISELSFLLTLAPVTFVALTETWLEVDDMNRLAVCKSRSGRPPSGSSG